MVAGNIRFGDETKPRAADRVDRRFGLRPPGDNAGQTECALAGISAKYLI